MKNLERRRRYPALPKRIFAVTHPRFGSSRGEKITYLNACSNAIRLGLSEGIGPEGQWVGEYKLVKRFKLRFVPERKSR